jgi:hypothetical protein
MRLIICMSLDSGTLVHQRHPMRVTLPFLAVARYGVRSAKLDVSGGVCWSIGVKWFLAGIVAVGISNASARSQMKIPTDPMRVSRLLERAETFVKDYPKDPAGVRVLGDIHACAFEHRAFYLNSHWSTQFRKDKPPSVYAAVPGQNARHEVSGTEKGGLLPSRL